MEGRAFEERSCRFRETSAVCIDGKGKSLFRLAKTTVVRVKGLEPPRLAALGPKPSASTNSATPAYRALSNKA